MSQIGNISWTIAMSQFTVSIIANTTIPEATQCRLHEITYAGVPHKMMR